MVKNTSDISKNPSRKVFAEPTQERTTAHEASTPTDSSQGATTRTRKRTLSVQSDLIKAAKKIKASPSSEANTLIGLNKPNENNDAGLYSNMPQDDSIMDLDLFHSHELYLENATPEENTTKDLTKSTEKHGAGLFGDEYSNSSSTGQYLSYLEDSGLNCQKTDIESPSLSEAHFGNDNDENRWLQEEISRPININIPDEGSHTLCHSAQTHNDHSRCLQDTPAHETTKPAWQVRQLTKKNESKFIFSSDELKGVHQKFGDVGIERLRRVHGQYSKFGFSKENFIELFYKLCNTEAVDIPPLMAQLLQKATKSNFNFDTGGLDPKDITSVFLTHSPEKIKKQIAFGTLKSTATCYKPTQQYILKFIQKLKSLVLTCNLSQQASLKNDNNSFGDDASVDNSAFIHISNIESVNQSISLGSREFLDTAQDNLPDCTHPDLASLATYTHTSEASPLAFEIDFSQGILDEISASGNDLSLGNTFAQNVFINDPLPTQADNNLLDNLNPSSSVDRSETTQDCLFLSVASPMPLS